MNWDNTTLFSDDQAEDLAFRAEIRDWIAKNCPRELINRPDRINPPEMKPWHRKLFERGWIAPHWPKAYGGMGATLKQQIILYEEINRAGAPTPFQHGLNLAGPIIMQAGTAEQKARHLPGILSGDKVWCQGYSETGAGSDLASLQTRAALEGDHFVVNGHKIWTTNGPWADWMFALVRTASDGPRQAGISMLLIDMKSPGITVQPIKNITGHAEFAQEFFDNVKVPRENLVGEINGGWKLANIVLGNERFTTGSPRAAALRLNKAREVARVSGALHDPAFRQQLASMEIELLAFSAYYHHGASLHAAGKAPASMGPVMKVFGGDLSHRAAELVMQTGGSIGPQVQRTQLQDGEHDIAEDLFASRISVVGGGTTEIQKNIISKRVLDLP
ncbi:MAG: acyl-CoA dehydrogenase family protein [Burkholderiales bacterium]